MRQRRFLAGFVCLSLLAGSRSFADDPPPQETQGFLTPANIVVKAVRLTDNGDNDGFADPNETVNVFVTLRNSTLGTDRTGLVVTVASTDPTVDCIPTPVLAFGNLAAGETRESTTAAVIRIANVVRTDPFASLTATLDFQISGDDFGGTRRSQQVVLDLDLNVSGGILPNTFTEGFEAAGFGAFTTMTLDMNMNTNALSDGHRCQYNDPDFTNANSYGNTNCFLGALNPANNAYDWHVHGTGSPDGGRAYVGNNALHWGLHPGVASADTTRLKQLDAIRTTLPINLGWNGVTSELRFKQQVGLTGAGFLSGPQFGTVDRGIVQIQLAGSTGTGVGNWRKISPYENLYDSFTMDNYTNCQFDPTDDGTTEDDYFFPTDPERRVGPSSTCYPEFSFTRLGAIFWSDVFDPADIHQASDGPGLQGSLGPGTWVESKFDLARYRGRRLRLRFLVSTIEIGTAVTWEQAIGWNTSGRGEADDGWYIDDVQVTNTLTSQATVSVDTADRSGLPTCGPVCGSVTASLVATPNTVGPDEAVTLDASGSAADQCPGGALHYRFWLDTDANGLLDFYSGPLFSPPDRVLQEWSPSATITHTRNATSLYAVEVRCSTRPACTDTAFLEVPFVCPSIAPVPFPSPLVVAIFGLSWDGTNRTDVIRGDLHALRASGGQFNGTVLACMVNSTFATSLNSYELPEPGQAFYYLAKEDGRSPLCGFNTWGTGSSVELPGAGGTRDDDIPLDPDTCSAAN